MKVPLISEQTLTFSEGKWDRERTDFTREASASLEKLPSLGTRTKVCEKKGDSSGSDPTQHVNEDMNKSLTVRMHYCDLTAEGYLTLWTTGSNGDCYKVLQKILGTGSLVDIEFHLGTANGDDQININETTAFSKLGWVCPSAPDSVHLLGHGSFQFTDSLSRKWTDKRNTFTGMLSVNLRLNDNHPGKILLLSGEVQNPLLAVNKRLQMDTSFTDATLVPADGEGIKCHKIFLTANSEVFEKMFETKMKKGHTSTVNIPDMSSNSVHALLDYLYCLDTTKASTSASLALELLMKADEYAIESLEKEMLKLIDAKGNDWFPVGVAFKLFQFAKNKFENEGLLIYQLVRHKAAIVLKSKSKKEVQDLFKTEVSQMDLLTYFMFSV